MKHDAASLLRRSGRRGEASREPISMGASKVPPDAHKKAPMMTMNGIANQAAFYRGYQADERNLVPLTILLAAAVPLWLLVYLVGTSKPAVTNDIRSQDRCELLGGEGYFALAME